jgi:phage/plasmid-like protein (TIGR03299 family)
MKVSTMAHELSFFGNSAEAFFALKPAWHGLGTVLDHAPTSEVAMQAAHLDWRVSLEPLQTQTLGGIAVPDNFATVRSDTKAVLGVVSDKYKLVQNRQAFAFLDSLIESGDMRYESAGALKGGKVVWILGRMPEDDLIAEGDVSRRYVLFSTSHDGSAAIHAIPTSTRVVCANTLRIAIAGDKGIRHTGDVRGKLDVARRYLSQFNAGFTLFRDQAQLLAQRRFTPEQAKEYINTLFPEVKEFNRARSNREKKIALVRKNYANPRQNLASIKGTWWALLNSVTELVDHAPQTRRSSSRDAQELKMMSTLDGTGATFKSDAYKLALKMASV